MPQPGDGEGLIGPVQFASWWFGSDFIYGDRMDVEVYMLTFQLTGFTPISSRNMVAGSQRTYGAPAFVVDAVRERNRHRQKRRGQKRPQPVSEEEESDALPKALRGDEIETINRLPNMHILLYTRPPVLASVVSSLPPQGAEVPNDVTTVLAVPYERLGGVGGLTSDNPFSGSSVSNSAIGPVPAQEGVPRVSGSGIRR